MRIVLYPEACDAVIFDMDGVVTDTARLHARVWKEMFDDYLAHREEGGGGDGSDRSAPQAPFDIAADYPRYVDGKLRYDGVRSFLESRGIHIDEGTPDDPPERETICGLGNRKNRLFIQRLREKGAERYEDAVDLVQRLRRGGIRVAVISASKNAREVLERAGVADLFGVRIDGVTAEEADLRGKPAPDVFLEAAKRLGAAPERSAIVEDARAGIEAGRAGGFRWVIGVARSGGPEALIQSGADAVVRDLSHIAVGGPTSRASHDGDWALVYDAYEPEEEGVREALCALGNGYFVTRGAAPDSAADAVHYPGTYLAGGYDRAVTDVHGRQVENEDLVNFPNWLPLTFRVGGGDWFRIDATEILDFRQELNLRSGLLLRTFRFRDAEGRTTRWAERRLVSMDDMHLAALSLTLIPENWEGAIEIRSGLDGTVINGGVARYRELESRHLEVLDAQALEPQMLQLRCRTRQSGVEVVQVARTRLFRGAAELAATASDASRAVESRAGWIAELCGANIAPHSPLTVEKVVSLYTTRDRGIAEPGEEARQAARRADRFEEIFAAHQRAWQHLWEDFDLVVDMGDTDDVHWKVRLQTFHLLQTASPHSIDLDVGVPARGWHGEAYRGHIFWDELFIFPLLNLRMPTLTRALLQYRYRRLPAARRAAEDAGRRGAMFPWQSGSSGREESQRLHLNPRSGRWLADASQRQRHISSAVAYNVWQYHEVTNDHDFLYFFGAEMILEIARFWGSMARHDAALDRYDILGVMGPDEYHTAYPDADPEENGGLSNNAYTNVMAAWVLSRARDVLDRLPAYQSRRLRETIGLGNEEIERWKEVSRKLKVCFHGDRIISQFEGYEGLAELDWKHYRREYGDIQRLDRILEAEGDSTNRYKVSKQADVLMLFYLFSADELSMLFEQLGYPFDADLIRRNLEYYLARTSHGSSLSWLTHSWVLARSNRPASWELFCRALDSDLADVQGGTTREGIHLGAMAGSVDLLHRCYTGLETRSDVLHFDPCLPEGLQNLRLQLRYRGHLLDVEVSHQTMAISSRPFTAHPITIAYRGRLCELAPGGRLELSLLTPGELARAQQRD